MRRVKIECWRSIARGELKLEPTESPVGNRASVYLVTLGKAYLLNVTFQELVQRIVDGQNPKLDPIWALNEIGQKLLELRESFEK